MKAILCNRKEEMRKTLPTENTFLKTVLSSKKKTSFSLSNVKHGGSALGYILFNVYLLETSRFDLCYRSKKNRVSFIVSVQDDQSTF